MSFTMNATTDRGKVRLLCYDTDSDDYTFDDDSIDAFLEQNSDSVWLAAADACRSLAAKSASSTFSLKIPGAIELDKKQIAKVYLSLAEKYEGRASGSVDQIVEYWDSYGYDLDIHGIDETEYVGDN